MKAPIGINWARTATARQSTAGPRGQMEMFGPAPVPDVVYPQRMGWMYGDPAFDNTLDLPQPRTAGGRSGMAEMTGGDIAPTTQAPAPVPMVNSNPLIPAASHAGMTPANAGPQLFTPARAPARPAARPAMRQAPVSYDNGGVRTSPHGGIDDETRMAAMRALGIMP